VRSHQNLRRRLRPRAHCAECSRTRVPFVDASASAHLWYQTTSIFSSMFLASGFTVCYLLVSHASERSRATGVKRGQSKRKHKLPSKCRASLTSSLISIRMLSTRNGCLILRVQLGRLCQRHCSSVVEPFEAVSEQSTDASLPVLAISFCCIMAC